MGPHATRRGFLRFAGTTASLTALARLRVVPATARAGDDEPQPFDERLFDERLFDEREREILTRILERVVDSGHPDAPAVAQTRAVETVEDLCRTLDPSVVDQLRWLLLAFEYGPFVFDLAFSRFSRMTDAERDTSLRGWMTSRLALRRLAFTGMRNLCLVAWYSQEETWPLIGYAGPLVGGRRAAS